VRDGGTITDRPDDGEPTVEMRRDHADETPRTRVDLPQRRADPTREDLPRRRSPWRRVRRVFFLVVALVVGTPLAAGCYVWYVAREDVRTHSDAIIVLGAAQFNGTPSDVLAWRLRHALTLYNDGVAKHILTVGGNRPGDNYTEAGSGKAWLNEHGVPADHLVAVPTGSDTLQSMIAAGEEFRKLHWHTAVIVTDPPHALRSRTMARANGIKAVTSPTRSGPTVYSRDTQFHYIVRETGGYLYFQLWARWHDEP
jgi:vancomycin permeability regulator SanA